MQKPNKYRRAFEFRIVRGDDPSTPKGIQAFLRLSLPQYAEVLEDYLEIGKKRRNSRFALAKLQLHLLHELATIEKAISELKHQAETVKTKPVGTPTGEQEVSAEVVDEIDRHIYFHRAHANCIRSIGDSLAWRAVGYDRAVLRALCQNPVKQRVIGDSTQQELDEWSRATHADDGLAVLNSITNCLSIGDITVVRNDGTIEILEVKASGTKSRRLTRQKQKMREILTLLNFGQGELDFPEVELLTTEVFPENGLAELSSTLQEAMEKGWAGRRLSNFLFIECHDYRRIENFDEMERASKENRRNQSVDWTSRGDRILPMTTFNTLQFNPNCPPFSIFPFPTHVRVGLLTGGMEYTSFLNISALEREFERLGWDVEKRPEDLLAERGDLDTGFMTLAKGPLHTTIGPAEIARMGYEALRPKVIIQVLEERLQMGPGSAQRYGFTVYSREHEIWD
jgi:hypothetical protein